MENDISSRDYHLWDTWTYVDQDTKAIHLFSLCAPHEKFLNGEHHLHSNLAHGIGPTLDNISFHTFTALPPSTERSIWSGCTIKAPNGVYQIYFTERTESEETWAHQRIKRATSFDLYNHNFTIDPHFSLSPSSFVSKESPFLTALRALDRTVHAWRDPFIFSHAGTYFMLIAAKIEKSDGSLPGCITLLRSNSPDLSDWALVTPALVSGYEELEVPQIYRDRTTGELVLVASTWDESDYVASWAKGASPKNSKDPNVVRTKGKLLGFRAQSFENLLLGNISSTEVLLSPDDGIYAAQIIPELSGDTVGFHPENGGLVILKGKFPKFERLS